MSVRFVKNVFLNVQFEDNTEAVPFAAGDTHEVSMIERDKDNYNNIRMPDGSVIMGVASEVFEVMGNTPIVMVDKVDEEKEVEVDNYIVPEVVNGEETEEIDWEEQDDDMEPLSEQY
jgi:hypothetical protein